MRITTGANSTARFIICLGVLSFLSIEVYAQKDDAPVDSIIDKHIAASGGAETWKAIQAVRLTGVYVYRGQDFPVTILKARPQMFRMEISTNRGWQIYIFDGTAARSVDAQTGETTAIRDPRVQHFVEMMADFDGALVDYRSKGHRVRLAGTETVENRPAHVLEVVLEDSSTERWLIDAETFLLVKRSSTFLDDNEQSTQTLYFLDYRPISGVMVPHYLERNVGHYVYGYEIERVEINPSIKDY